MSAKCVITRTHLTVMSGILLFSSLSFGVAKFGNIINLITAGESVYDLETVVGPDDAKLQHLEPRQGTPLHYFFEDKRCLAWGYLDLASERNYFLM